MPASQPPQRIRSRLSPDERIAKILTTTRELLSEKGYENLFTAEIAERCGISEATIFKYFQTKRELLTRVTEQWFAELVNMKNTTPQKHSVRLKLRQLIWENLATISREPALSRFVLMELRADPGYKSMHIYQLNRQYNSRILGLLKDAIASGTFRSDVPIRLLMNIIYGAMEHETWAYLRGEGKFDAEAAASGISEVIYRGMVKSAAPTKQKEMGGGSTTSKSATASPRKPQAVKKTPNKSVRAEPFDVTQDRLVEAQVAPARGFDKLNPNGRVLNRRFLKRIAKTPAKKPA